MERLKAERHILYKGYPYGDGMESLIGYYIDEKTGEKQYFELREFEYTEENSERLQIELDELSRDAGRHFEIIYRKRTDRKTGEVEFKAFVSEDLSENEAMERKEIHNSYESSRQADLNSGDKGGLSKKLKVGIAAGFAALAIAGTAVGLSSLNKDSSEFYTDSVASDVVHDPSSPYDDLSYDTYLNEGNNEMIELSDALIVSKVCLETIRQEVEAYNARVPESQRYNFNFDIFSHTDFTGEHIRESSVIELAVDKPDINEKCRGPLKIGSLGAKEANIVCENLTGEKILVSDDDFYDLTKAYRACIYIAIRNFEYCADIVGPENVTSAMVFDTYLHGCGNVRAWLRQCLDSDGRYNGGYEPRPYSQDVLYYGDSLDGYWEALESGKTDGSHDEFFKITYDKLYAKPSFSKIQAEPGE